MKLLIVDDSAIIRRAINTTYEKTVFDEIKTASDGLLALTVFKQQLPDLVTLDITMPYMDGLATLTQMLEIKPNTNIMVVSALADHHTAIESLVRGANQFICKPFTDQQLMDALETVLAQMKQKNEKRKPLRRRQSRKPVRQGEIITPEAPSPESYPSGFVEAPRIELPKEDSAVQRQRSFKP